MNILLFILISIILFYLLLNLLHNISITNLFGKQCIYLSVKELKRYRTENIRLGLAYVEFDYTWGIKVSPLTFWYLLYISFTNYLSIRKTPWNNYL